MSAARLRAASRPLVAPLALVALHALALRGLYACDVAASLLGAAAAPNMALVALVALFYALRLVVYFVVPGWLALALVRAVRVWRNGGGTRPRSTAREPA